MEVLGHGTGQVWIENHPTDGWAPGRVDSVLDGGKYLVVDEGGQKFEVAQNKLLPIADQACLKGVDDLLALGDFNEGALLHNIRVRYFKDDIYTGIGNPILISVNPYANFPGLYSEAKQKFYRDRGMAIAQGLDDQIPPHLFSVGDAAYRSMLSENTNQSLIISGESGAGKTEATKRILIYFAGLQGSQKSDRKESGDTLSIEQQVLRSNPILEAFGNAKTIRNDNSSRFGKFIEIEFDNLGKLLSARISNYLLEKCRIVTQQPNERNYHSFYQLCAGVSSLGSLADMLHLQDSGDHAYINVCTDVANVDDAQEFSEMTDCMQSLGFTTEERNSVFKVVAAVLHLGDMEFQEHADTADGTKIVDDQKAGWICEMLGVELQDFIKVFQYKTLEDPFTKKIIDMPQDVAGSSNTRHSMAKVAYSRLFDWLVWRINQSTMSKTAKKDSRKIGILDIFGFEIFEWNSFEQLCINFANEKLQQHFNSHMFTLEQRLYTEEGISWGHIEFQDNREIIDTLERKPLGLFPLFDSECLMPNSTDQTCLSKIYSSFKTSKIVKKPDRFASTNFAVAHYAGEVIYDIISFLEKNTDKLHADILNLLKGSKMPLLKTLFSDPKFAPEADGAGASAKTAPKRASGPAVGGGRAKQSKTVSMMFREQLDTLVEDLNKTAPRYIRCIKPNPNKQPHEFESIDIMRQLRCAGMLESIRIRKAGYSVRRLFKEFFNRFRVLCPHLSIVGKADPDYKELSRKILQDVEAKLEKEGKPLEPKSWQVGRSKVFLKDELQSQMEKRIGDAIKHYVLKIQKVWRGFKLKKRYRDMKRAVVKVQAGMLTLKAATEFKAYRQRMQSALVLQAALRMLPYRTSFDCRRKGAVKIQKVFRGRRSRQKVGKLKGKMAAERIQRMREEESRQEALQAAQRAADEKAKAMEDMQKQMALERERYEEEARLKIEAQQKQQSESPSKEVQERAQREQEQSEVLRQEMLDLRKENARLQGQIECQANSPSRSAASDAEIEQMRKELSEARREKARMEVELTTSKSSKEYDAILAEANQLREDASQLRRAKLDAELQLEQKTGHVETLQARVERAEQQASELSNLRGLNDELQVQVQRLQAQKATLEDRVQNEEASRVELTNLRLEKMRLEGDLETSRMREEAMNDKMKETDERSVELQQQRQKVMTAEVELDAARRQIERLKEQVADMSKDGSDKRNASLDQLRSELLGRIEAKPVPSGRPSILPTMADNGASGEGRQTLLNQRAIFEQLKQQFNDAKTGGEDIAEVPYAEVSTREFELEEDLRQVKKENVELTIRISSLEDEVRVKGGEAGQYLQGHAIMAAEIQDLKFQVEQESSSVNRLTQENGELQALLIERESEATSLRRQKTVAEERLVQAEEDRDAVRQKVMRIEEDRTAFEQRSRQLQAQISDAAARETKLQALYEEQRLWAERYQRIAEEADRKRAEIEAAGQDAEAERERLKIELSDANFERAKIKQIVDEVTAQGGKNDELEREVEKWKVRCNHFEREYTQSKQLNTEMTKVMSQMTQSISERSENNSDAVKQNKILFKQLEASKQAERTARSEKEEIQKQLDSLQSTGSYFQDKYKEASNEIRTLKQDVSVSSASLSKMRIRLESLQKENDDLKSQMGKLTHELRVSSSDSGRVDQYEHTVRDLQAQLSKKSQDLESTQTMFAKSQQVSDCLNTLLVLETEQKGLYEKYAPISDTVVARELSEKKSKTDHVITRLNQIMQDDEQASRPSILDHSFR